MKTFESFNSNTGDNNVQNRENMESKEKLPEPVYHIESPEDNTVLVGIDVTIDHSVSRDGNAARVSWYDTTRERVMTAAETKRDNENFTFRRIEHEGGGTYRFTPMNLDIYNRKVKKHLAAGPAFANNDDLIKAFLGTIEDEF